MVVERLIVFVLFDVDVFYFFVDWDDVNWFDCLISMVEYLYYNWMSFEVWMVFCWSVILNF